MKLHYSVCLNDWTLYNPGNPANFYNVKGVKAKLFGIVFAKCNIETGLNGMNELFLMNLNCCPPMLLADPTVR
jgi:hypothetical protein